MNFKYLFSKDRFMITHIDHVTDTSYGLSTPSTYVHYYDKFKCRMKKKYGYGIGYLTIEDALKFIKGEF